MKKLILLIGFITLSTYSSSQCQKGDCKNGFSTKKYTDAIYEGNFKDEKYDGLGLMFYNDKRIYHGEYKNNTYNGYGYYKWKTGETYFGSWKNGLQSGLGIQKNANGEIQSAGIWVDGKNTSPLNTTSPTNNPENCTGNCVDGIGRLIAKDSTTFLGVFKGKKIVLGSIQRKEYIYNGEIKNGVPYGYGQIKYLNTNEYFLGYFNNGEKHGVGIFTDKNNKRTYGNWINDKYQDPTKFEFDQKDFCKELIALAKLNKKERHELKVKEKHTASVTLEKQFLNQFKLKSDSYADDFYGKEKIYFYFPNKDEDKPTIGYKELIDACKSCKKLTPTKDSYFQYNDVELSVGKYSLTMTLTYPKPDPCISGNCKNGKGEKQYVTSVYNGQFKDGLRHGKGKETYENGNSYEGEYENDQSYGKGVFLWKDGDRYEGSFIDGFREGTGTYYYKSGSKYIGEHKKSKFEGSGKRYSKEGKLLYEGNFINSKYDGQGTFYYTDGYKYIGKHKNSSPNGFGIKYNKEGGKYFEGNYIDGKEQGKGILYFINGKKAYEGNFESGKRSGQGAKYYTNGKFVGTFKDDLRQGTGKFYNLEGKLTFEGLYEDDKRHGKGISYYTNGEKGYEGNFENGKRSGQGTKYYTDGKYIGEFKDGNRHGTGKFYNLEGKLTFEGQYKDDKQVK